MAHKCNTEFTRFTKRDIFESMRIEDNNFRNRLIVFGRYPVPGKTKTRLIPLLGPAGAAEIQKILMEKILIEVKQAAARHGSEVEVCFSDGSEVKMEAWLGSGVLFSPQSSGDLGRRMFSAFCRAFDSGCHRVVLMGTDVPGLTASYLERALNALEKHDLVIGPSTDGGYVLIGLTNPANVFEYIDWGTDLVLAQTKDLANHLTLDVHLLDPLKDIDTPDDYQKWRPGMRLQDPYLSVIIPALNEAKHIESSIRSARSKDSEVIVVDGGSSDNTVALAEYAGARVLKSQHGRSSQQNHGARIANGKVLLFLHADTILPEGYVDPVFEALMDPLTTIGAFRFKTDGDSLTMRFISFMTNLRARYLKLPYGDQGLFIRKSLFQSTGGFPEVLIAEDLFLVKALSKKGRVRIVPADIVTSARRWQEIGVARTILINQMIAVGCYLGVPPGFLARFYRSPRRRKQKRSI